MDVRSRFLQRREDADVRVDACIVARDLNGLILVSEFESKHWPCSTCAQIFSDV